MTLPAELPVPPDVLQTLAGLGFPALQPVEGRSSIANLFGPAARCGVYVLRFATGEWYAGQAVDVTRRFVQHRAVHDDIAAVTFRRVGRRKLDAVEREVIWTLEQAGLPLRNIALTAAPALEHADFDLLMPPDEQARWLADPGAAVASVAPRPESPDQRRKYEKRIAAFLRLPHAAATLRVMRSYVQRCVPAPYAAEGAFWTCSCLPKSGIYSRVNANWQEVLTVGEFDGMLVGSFHVALSPLEQAFGTSLRGLRRLHPGIMLEDHFYEPGGVDQANVIVEGQAAAEALLAEPAFLQAARLLNLRLVRRGLCPYSRTHCPNLADHLLGPAPPAV